MATLHNGTSEGRGALFPPLLLAVTVVLAYLGSFSGVFQYDDYLVIVGNDAVHSLAGWLADLPHGIRPLLKLSYTLNWISGLGLFGFHLVNLAIHLGNVLLVYLLARRLFPEHRGPLPAVVAAAFFGLHPIQTEAVTYICGRSVSLMTFFYLAGLLSHVRGREEGGRILTHLVSPLFFLLALMTKETAATYPAALLLWEMTRHGVRRGFKEGVRSSAVSWEVLAAGLLFFLAHPRYGALLEYCFDIRGWRENLSAQGNAVAYLLSRLVVLNGMNIDPDITPEPGVEVLPMALLPLAGLLLVRRIPWAAFAVFWFFLHLAPTNSVVPRLDLVNDRQAYLPLMGIAILCGGICANPARSWPRSAAAVLLLTVPVLGAFTWQRNRDYRSEILLWEDAARKSPKKARVFNNLGYAYVLAGKPVAAAAAYRAAMTLDPADPRPRNNLDKLSPGARRLSLPL